MAATDEEAADAFGLLQQPMHQPLVPQVFASGLGARHPHGPRRIAVAAGAWVLSARHSRSVRGMMFAAAVLGVGALLGVQLLRRPAALSAASSQAAGEGVVALREAHRHEKGILTEESPVGKGWKIIVESQTGHQRECTITERDGENHRLRIHYNGFPDAYDEWVPLESSRIVSVLPTTTSTSTTETTTSITTTTVTTTSVTVTTSTSSSTTTMRLYASLFCFTMTRSDEGNSEIDLVRLQLEKRVGLFDCDEQIVFSDRETWLSAGPTLLKNRDAPILISTYAVGADLTDAKDDSRKSAWLNAGDYVKCWQEIVLDGRYRWHDWTVKVDPDTVFLPARLRDRLKEGYDTDNKPVYLKTCKTTPRKCTNLVKVSRQYGPEMEFKVIASSTDTYSVSSICNKESAAATPCIANGWGDGVHVIVNQNGKMIGEGNCCNEQNEVRETVHDCAQQQFESHDPGLSGALEIVSKAAVDLYSENGHRCKADSYLDMGEEFFMQECFKLLGCEGLPGELLLQDDFCGGVPGDCHGPEVAFHPFKTLKDHIKCMGNAFMDLSTPELHSDLLRVTKADG